MEQNDEDKIKLHNLKEIQQKIKRKPKYFESGAHFAYQDLYNKLLGINLKINKTTFKKDVKIKTTGNK
jgi:hypothetical protein